MIRLIMFATALAVPLIAHADEVWRWRDASGQPHYSNLPGRVPAYAEPLRRDIGHLSSAVPAEDAAAVQADLDAYGKLRRQRMQERQEVRPTEPRSCWPFGFPYVVINNPHELSDQVKQANLLDALGIAWRKGCCQ